MEDRLVKNAQGYVTGTTSTANSAAFVTAIKADCNWATTLPVVRQTNATVTSTTNVISVWTSTVVTTYSKIGILNPGSVTRNATNPRFIGMAIRPFKNRFS
jgi:ABC-type spermidine/putrescine transport system permease subunit I